jgi:hypothetical protein
MAALIPQLQHSTWAGLKNFKARVLQLKAEANDGMSPMLDFNDY